MRVWIVFWCVASSLDVPAFWHVIYSHKKAAEPLRFSIARSAAFFVFDFLVSNRHYSAIGTISSSVEAVAT